MIHEAVKYLTVARCELDKAALLLSARLLALIRWRGVAGGGVLADDKPYPVRSLWHTRLSREVVWLVHALVSLRAESLSATETVVWPLLREISKIRRPQNFRSNSPNDPSNWSHGQVTFQPSIDCLPLLTQKSSFSIVKIIVIFSICTKL